MSKHQEMINVQLQITDKKEIGKMNERIKALLDIKRYQHDDKVADYLRTKNKEAKIKRTRGLRKNHLMTICDGPQPRDFKKLSIESLKIQGAYHIEKQSPASNVDQLKQFEEDFSNGKIDDKYQQMLNTYIQEYGGALDMDKEQFIKRATKQIKQKLFAFYLEQNKEKLVGRKHTLESNAYLSIESTKSRQIKRKHTRMMSQDFLNKYQYSQHKKMSTPYALKSPNKFNKAHIQGIQKSYLNEMQNIDYAKKVNQKKRKIKQQAFLMRLRDRDTPMILKL